MMNGLISASNWKEICAQWQIGFLSALLAFLPAAGASGAEISKDVTCDFASAFNGGDEPSRERAKSREVLAMVVKACTESIRQESGHTLAEKYSVRGNAHLFMNENALALADFDAAVRTDGSDPGYRLNRAIALNGLERWKDAEREFSEVLRRPGSLSAYGKYVAYSNRGKSNFHMEKVDQSISDLTAAIKIQPANYDPYYWRTLAFALKGDASHALKDHDEWKRLKEASKKSKQ